MTVVRLKSIDTRGLSDQSGGFPFQSSVHLTSNVEQVHVLLHILYCSIFLSLVHFLLVLYLHILLCTSCYDSLDILHIILLCDILGGSDLYSVISLRSESVKLFINPAVYSTILANQMFMHIFFHAHSIYEPQKL